MKRFIQNHLLYWKTSAHRKPLIIRGARQVGKTTLVRDFGRREFASFVEINFELQPQLKQIFTTLDANTLIEHLVLTLGQEIREHVTLLFLDEIQECPQAIMALRYFYEKCPGLHVIAAGSLIEFALESKDFRMPVGRVEYLYMQPLSFGEFLLARGEATLNEYLAKLSIGSVIPDSVHHKCLQLFKQYLIVGGMPEVVAAYQENPASLDFQNIQLSILQTYRDDFGKYALRSQHPYLDKVFNAAPFQVGQIYKYSQVDRDVQSRDLKAALTLLVRAGLLTKVLATSGHGLPFLKDVHEKKFKLLFLDVGLMQRAFGQDALIALGTDFISIQAGAIAEQAVGQEWLACRNPRETPELFFWFRDKKGSQAEVDFLIQIGAHSIPMEVKSGKTGTLKSLQLFLNAHPTPFGIRFSQLPLSFHDRILSIPIYAVAQATQIATGVLSSLP